jgi:hypothetical protein
LIELVKGTKENLVVDVEDRLGNLATLDGTTPTYDVRAKYGDDFILQDLTANTNELQAFCLIDTTSNDLPIGQYELFLRFNNLPEVPLLGPMEFEIV